MQLKFALLSLDSLSQYIACADEVKNVLIGLAVEIMGSRVRDTRPCLINDLCTQFERGEFFLILDPVGRPLGLVTWSTIEGEIALSFATFLVGCPATFFRQISRFFNELWGDYRYARLNKNGYTKCISRKKFSVTNKCSDLQSFVKLGSWGHVARLGSAVRALQGARAKSRRLSEFALTARRFSSIGQIKVLVCDGQPTGYIIWAWLENKSMLNVQHGGLSTLPLDALNEGRNLCFLECGGAEKLHHSMREILLATLFPDVQRIFLLGHSTRFEAVARNSKLASKVIEAWLFTGLKEDDRA